MIRTMLGMISAAVARRTIVQLAAAASRAALAGRRFAQTLDPAATRKGLAPAEADGARAGSLLADRAVSRNVSGTLPA